MIRVIDGQTMWFCDGRWHDISNFDVESEMEDKAAAQDWIAELDESHPTWTHQPQRHCDCA